jgi:hypothetical protein
MELQTVNAAINEGKIQSFEYKNFIKDEVV